jgi:hypothetical protein
LPSTAAWAATRGRNPCGGGGGGGFFATSANNLAVAREEWARAGEGVAPAKVTVTAGFVGQAQRSYRRGSGRRRPLENAETEDVLEYDGRRNVVTPGTTNAGQGHSRVCIEQTATLLPISLVRQDLLHNGHSQERRKARVSARLDFPATKMLPLRHRTCNTVRRAITVIFSSIRVFRGHAFATPVCLESIGQNVLSASQTALYF